MDKYSIQVYLYSAFHDVNCCKAALNIRDQQFLNVCSYCKLLNSMKFLNVSACVCVYEICMFYYFRFNTKYKNIFFKCFNCNQKFHDWERYVNSFLFCSVLIIMVIFVMFHWINLNKICRIHIRAVFLKVLFYFNYWSNFARFYWINQSLHNYGNFSNISLN